MSDQETERAVDFCRKLCDLFDEFADVDPVNIAKMMGVGLRSFPATNRHADIEVLAAHVFQSALNDPRRLNRA